MNKHQWRYVSNEMLAVLCNFYELDILDSDVTKFIIRQ